ncbi:hypothetical protein SynA15127_00476 [Synechococcus sp. A15-127]|nr:hypothetical protein SynA15127_00476 [Synechococcus sp. A15-127]
MRSAADQKDFGSCGATSVFMPDLVMAAACLSAPRPRWRRGVIARDAP